MISRNLRFGSRVLAFFIFHYYLIVVAGAGNAGKMLQLSTSNTQRTALEGSGVNWTAPAGMEYFGGTAPAGDLAMSASILPSTPLRKARGRRGAADRLQPRYGTDCGSEAGIAEFNAASKVQPQHPRRDDVPIFIQREQEGPEAVAVSVDQQKTSKNDAALVLPGGDPSQWWRTRESIPVGDSWIRMQAAEGWSADEAGAALQEQEAASAAGLIPERRMRETGRARVNRQSSTVSLSLFLAGVAAAAVVGGLVSGSLMRKAAAARAARQHKSVPQPESWIFGPKKQSQRTIKRDVNATAKATINNGPYNDQDTIVDGLALVKMVTQALPVLILLWSPTAAALFLLYGFLRSALSHWEMHQKHSSPAGGHPVQMLTTWLSKNIKAK